MHCRTPILDRNLGEPLQLRRNSFTAASQASTGRRVSSGGGDLRRAVRCRRHWPPSSRRASSRRSASSATSAGITAAAASTSMRSPRGQGVALDGAERACGRRAGSASSTCASGDAAGSASLTNVVRVVSAEWRLWLLEGWVSKKRTPRTQCNKPKASERPGGGIIGRTIRQRVALRGREGENRNAFRPPRACRTADSHARPHRWRPRPRAVSATHGAGPRAGAQFRHLPWHAARPTSP